MIRSLALLFLLYISLNTCTAKIESNATNTTNNIEKSSNTTSVGDAKPAASSNYPIYAPAPSFLTTDFWRSGMGQALSIGGITATVLAVIGGLTWLFAPTFGFRMCNVLGNCDKAGISYNNGGNLQDANLQSNAINDAQYIYPYNNIPSYYKRSVDIVAPIIKNLASAVQTIEKITDKKS